jgi:glycerol-3-phosphate cytidylyltransferase
MKIGLIAGSFDVIHPGYIEMFDAMEEICDHIIVLLHDDPTIERPEKCKPVLPMYDRVYILSSLNQIDEIHPYNTEAELYAYFSRFEEEHLDKTVDIEYVRFLGDDYIGKSFTGDNLEIPIHYLNRDHGWSTTKFKKLIADEVQRSSNI